MQLLDKLSEKVERKLNPGRVLKLVPPDAKILTQKAFPYTGDVVTDTDLQQFVVDMIFTMQKHRGAGLAAPQVGSPLALVIIVDENLAPLPLLNPIITWESERKVYEKEGCLSLMGLFEPIWRAEEVRVKYLDLDGKEQEVQLSGLSARSAAHEIDHVNGLMFTERMSKVQRSALKKKAEVFARKLAKHEKLMKSLNRA